MHAKANYVLNAIIFFLTIHIKMVGNNPISQVGIIPTCEIGFELAQKPDF